MFVRAAVALAAAALSAVPAAALAEGDPGAPPAEELAEAGIIIDAMFPPDRREQMILDLAGAVANQAAAGFMTGPVFEDPGIRAIMDAYLAELPTRFGPLFARHMPRIFEATALAYTRAFTLEELRDIGAFARTPSGQRYFASLQTVQGDPAVAAATQAMFADFAPQQQEASARLRRQVEEYLTANPQVLEKLEKAGVGADR